MGKGFHTLDHTADIGIVACGESLAEAFSNAGRALFSVITDLESIREKEQRDIEVTASDHESLLVGWLNELVYLFDVEGMLFRRFEIGDLGTDRLTATAYGEPFEPSRHQLKVGVKAATYHMLQVETNERSRVQVLFDI